MRSSLGLATDTFALTPLRPFVLLPPNLPHPPTCPSPQPITPQVHSPQPSSIGPRDHPNLAFPSRRTIVQPPPPTPHPPLRPPPWRRSRFTSYPKSRQKNKAKEKGPGDAASHQISILAKKGETSWRRALDQIREQLDASLCEYFGYVDFENEDQLVDPYDRRRLALPDAHGESSPSRRQLGALDSPARIASSAVMMTSSQWEGDDAMRCAAAEGEACAHLEEEQWYAEWQADFEDWWLATPYSNALQHCIGAFGLHLASRLDWAWRAKFGGMSAFKPPANADAANAADPSCKWLENDGTQLQEELRIPDLPELPASFALPEVPPLPRLLPDWQRLQSLSQPLDGQAQGPSADEQNLGLGHVGGGNLSFGVGAAAGAGIGAAAVAAMIIVRRRMHGMRVSMRASCSAAPSVG